MKISDLKDGMRKVDIEGNVIEISEAREVNLRAGGQARVADVRVSDGPDATDSIVVSLWDDQIEKVNEGDKIKIESGYTNSFRGEIRLNVGRYGKLEVLE